MILVKNLEGKWYDELPDDVLLSLPAFLGCWLAGKVWTVPRGYLWDRLTAGELEFGNKRVLLDTWQAYLIVYVTGQ